MTAPRPKASTVLSASRAWYRLVLLAFPAHAITCTGAVPSEDSCQVVRLLGIRHLTQAAASVCAGRRVLAAGAVVDTLHAGSMLPLAEAVPRMRRGELADGPSRGCCSSSAGCQVRSIRRKVTSFSSNRIAAAAGIATRAPISPSSAPPTRTATTVTAAGTSTVRPIIRGTSR